LENGGCEGSCCVGKVFRAAEERRSGTTAVRQGWIVEGIGRRGSWSMFHVYGSGSVEYSKLMGKAALADTTDGQLAIMAATWRAS
jgi:hypothetical protein